MNIDEFSEKVESYDDFLVFLDLLNSDFSNKSENWENNRLDQFLESLSAYCKEKDRPSPSWKTFADILIAATVYE